MFVKFKNYYFLYGIIFAILLIYLLYNIKHHSGYNIVDYFTDSSNNSKITFIFIEVNKNNRENILKICPDLWNEYLSTKNRNDTNIKILIAHFYNKNSIKTIPNGLKDIITKKYRNNPEFINKINYIEEGYIYTGYSRKITGLGLPKDSLFKSPFIIPKPGYKAKDILKNNSLQSNQQL